MSHYSCNDQASYKTTNVERLEHYRRFILEHCDYSKSYLIMPSPYKTQTLSPKRQSWLKKRSSELDKDILREGGLTDFYGND